MPQGGARGQNLGHLYSCHLVIPRFLKNSSYCGDFKGKSLRICSHIKSIFLVTSFLFSVLRFGQQLFSNFY